VQRCKHPYLSIRWYPRSLLPACLFSLHVHLAGILVVYVTAPSAEVADSLATALVESRLVACVNIVPGLTSVYTWKVTDLVFSLMFVLRP
jgi:hypothetical protein